MAHFTRICLSLNAYQKVYCISVVTLENTFTVLIRHKMLNSAIRQNITDITNITDKADIKHIIQN